MLIVIQQMSAKVANVTKSDLATLLRTTFGARVATPAVLLMVIANVITMGADLMAMGAAFELLTGVKFVYWIVPLAAVMALVTIFTDYKVLSKYLLWLVAVLLIITAIRLRSSLPSLSERSRCSMRRCARIFERARPVPTASSQSFEGCWFGLVITSTTSPLRSL